MNKFLDYMWLILTPISYYLTWGLFKQDFAAHPFGAIMCTFMMGSAILWLYYSCVVIVVKPIHFIYKLLFKNPTAL